MKELYKIITEIDAIPKDEYIPAEIVVYHLRHLAMHIGDLEAQMAAMQIPADQRCRVCAEHWKPVASVIIGMDGKGRCNQHANYP